MNNDRNETMATQRAFRRLAWAAALLVSAMPGFAAAPLHFRPMAPDLAGTTLPPLPPLAQYPVQLVLDDGSPEGTVGVAGATARQFLWFNRFTPGQQFRLQEVWVLFSPGANISLGAAVEISIYHDPDGNPANGATLLQSFDTTILELDGVTFSRYPVAPAVDFPGNGDLWIGVVPRFIQEGVTPPTEPAVLDTTASQGRSWIGSWIGATPDPPAIPPIPDQQFSTVDGFQPGNWMIRAFGVPPAVVEVPTVSAWGLLALALALLVVGALTLRRSRTAPATGGSGLVER